jgi:hypothetical protein
LCRRLQTAEDFLTFKLAETLYKRLETEIQDHLQKEQTRVLSERVSDDEAFLVALNKTWLVHCDNMVRPSPREFYPQFLSI